MKIKKFSDIEKIEKKGVSVLEIAKSYNGGNILIKNRLVEKLFYEFNNPVCPKVTIDNFVENLGKEYFSKELLEIIIINYSLGEETIDFVLDIIERYLPHLKKDKKFIIDLINYNYMLGDLNIVNETESSKILFSWLMNFKDKKIQEHLDVINHLKKHLEENTFCLIYFKQPMFLVELKLVVLNRIGEAKKNNNLYVDFSDLDISNLKSMNYLFNGVEFYGVVDIGDWNTINLKTSGKMFCDTKFNQILGIEKLNVENIVNASCMFYKSKFNQSVSNWRFNKLLEAGWIFHQSKIDYFSVKKLYLNNITHLTKYQVCLY